LHQHMHSSVRFCFFDFRWKCIHRLRVTFASAANFAFRFDLYQLYLITYIQARWRLF
jgi:hypothetical protein